MSIEFREKSWAIFHEYLILQFFGKARIGLYEILWFFYSLNKSPASLILRNKENKELVQSFCLPFELKNADAMFCMRYFSKS